MCEVPQPSAPLVFSQSAIDCIDRCSRRKTPLKDDFGLLKAIWHQREGEGCFRQDKNHSKTVFFCEEEKTITKNNALKYFCLIGCQKIKKCA